ncbi:hypothetical protein F5Y05DRAFT_414726 [Hypoxylon sp. FL0543]|nr:hypothetical protein F5Y05DRAFT_414726 [Hypoxylon sp. FL0543]
MTSPPTTYLDLIKICDNFSYIDITRTPCVEPLNLVFYQLLIQTTLVPMTFYTHQSWLKCPGPPPSRQALQPYDRILQTLDIRLSVPPTAQRRLLAHRG